MKFFWIFIKIINCREIFKCDFETDWCGLEDYENSDFFIDENMGATTTSGTG